ncbi:MAG TPA: NAD(P)-dependent oxidoreductase [Lacipirellulaceae bacterium]|jgi:3-hydroxyisobutyrate dehydrogenase
MAIEVSPQKTRVGWIGTGVMGRSMCGHVIDAGYKVTVFNRTKSKADELVAKGARWADSPRDVAAAADVVFSIVGYPDDVREVLLGETGALAALKSGGIVVDMTTSRPSLAIEIAEAATKKGVVSIDAPVSGGDVGAKNGTLSIMIGGDAATVRALEPLWKTMGSKWVLQGGAGAGQHTKVVNQTLIASGMIGVCEALLYGYKAGLDLEKVLESVASGAAGSWSLSNYGPRMIAGNFEPGFFVEHFLKDVGIALEESRRMGLKMPGLEMAEQLYKMAAADGLARKGTQSLILALAKLSKVEWPSK